MNSFTKCYKKEAQSWLLVFGEICFNKWVGQKTRLRLSLNITEFMSMLYHLEQEQESHSVLTLN